MELDRIRHRLRNAREEKGWSRTHLANLIGVPYPTYCNWEAGWREPSLAMIVKLADLLGLRERDFLQGGRDGNTGE